MVYWRGLSAQCIGIGEGEHDVAVGVVHARRQTFGVDSLAAPGVAAPARRRHHAAPAVWTQFLSDASGGIGSGDVVKRQAARSKRHATEFLLGWLWSGQGADQHGDHGNDDTGHHSASSSEVQSHGDDKVAASASKAANDETFAQATLDKIRKEVDEVKAAAAKLESADPLKDSASEHNGEQGAVGEQPDKPAAPRKSTSETASKADEADKQIEDQKAAAHADDQADKQHKDQKAAAHADDQADKQHKDQKAAAHADDQADKQDQKAAAHADDEADKQHEDQKAVAHADDEADKQQAVKQAAKKQAAKAEAVLQSVADQGEKDAKEDEAEAEDEAEDHQVVSTIRSGKTN